MMRASRFSPGVLAGMFGMLLVEALYIAHALLLMSGGRGLSTIWLLLLVLPGGLAAFICSRRGMPAAVIREGVLAGLVMGHLAAALQVAVVVLGAFTTDWARYGQQVGSQIASAVQNAALPATIIAAVVAAVVSYSGCAAAGWLGALIYLAARNIFSK